MTVVGLSGVSAIAAGGYTCALGTDGDGALLGAWHPADHLLACPG